MDRSWEKEYIYRLIQSHALYSTVSLFPALKLTSIFFSQFAKKGGALEWRSIFPLKGLSDLVTPLSLLRA